ncbi:MAG TPA: hypothetical protein VG406_17370 [Isosphaeraceae bacterium]|jgi:hypothetical protein|nr:hypothetical protein [Isosphaeraceae bacterium]
MSTAARPRARRLADVALAPLTWLERARGRWRLALAVLYLVILVVVAALTWRAFSLWALPDIGEPFDVAAFTTCDVPDDQNAFVLYEQAAARLRRPIVPLTGEEDRGLPEYVLNSHGSRASTDPTFFETEERAWLDVNADALALWRRGAERSRVCPRDTEEPIGPGGWHVLDAMAQLTALGLLKAERLKEAGEVDEAWGWYNAALRCNRHLLARGEASGVFVARQWQDIQWRILIWSKHPAVNSALLRRALDDVVAADALTPPEADAIRRHYLDLRDELGKARGRWIEDERAAEMSPISHMVFEADLRWL